MLISASRPGVVAVLARKRQDRPLVPKAMTVLVRPLPAGVVAIEAGAAGAADDGDAGATPGTRTIGGCGLDAGSVQAHAKAVPRGCCGLLCPEPPPSRCPALRTACDESAREPWRSTAPCESPVTKLGVAGPGRDRVEHVPGEDPSARIVTGDSEAHPNPTRSLVRACVPRESSQTIHKRRSRLCPPSSRLSWIGSVNPALVPSEGLEPPTDRVETGSSIR